VRYGYRKIRVLLNREGWDVGKYLVYRLYKEEGLTLKRMKPAGKRKASRQREEKLKVTAPDQASEILTKKRRKIPAVHSHSLLP
jgi:putative transposase